MGKERIFLHLSSESIKLILAIFLNSCPFHKRHGWLWMGAVTILTMMWVNASVCLMDLLFFCWASFPSGSCSVLQPGEPFGRSPVPRSAAPWLCLFFPLPSASLALRFQPFRCFFVVPLGLCSGGFCCVVDLRDGWLTEGCVSKEITWFW